MLSNGSATVTFDSETRCDGDSVLGLWMNNYIVRSYGDVIVVTKIATRRTNKAQSIGMY